MDKQERACLECLVLEVERTVVGCSRKSGIETALMLAINVAGDSIKWKGRRFSILGISLPTIREIKWKKHLGAEWFAEEIRDDSAWSLGRIRRVSLRGRPPEDI